MNFLLVFLGGGLGSALRHGVNVVALRLVGSAYPYGTFFINIAGSFVMGLIVEYFALKGTLPAQARLFLTTGIMGGFTTFSAFSLETAALHQRGETGIALLYAGASVVVGVAALFGAMALVRSLLQP